MSKLIFTDIPTDNNTDATNDGMIPCIVAPSTAKKDAIALLQSVFCLWLLYDTSYWHLIQQHPHLLPGYRYHQWWQWQNSTQRHQCDYD